MLFDISRRMITASSGTSKGTRNPLPRLHFTRAPTTSSPAVSTIPSGFGTSAQSNGLPKFCLNSRASQHGTPLGRSLRLPAHTPEVSFSMTIATTKRPRSVSLMSSESGGRLCQRLLSEAGLHSSFLTMESTFYLARNTKATFLSTLSMAP